MLNLLKDFQSFHAGSLHWYEGSIVSARGGRFVIYYTETDEKCNLMLHEVKEDFISGDLFIV